MPMAVAQRASTHSEYHSTGCRHGSGLASVSNRGLLLSRTVTFQVSVDILVQGPGQAIDDVQEAGTLEYTILSTDG